MQFLEMNDYKKNKTFWLLKKTKKQTNVFITTNGSYILNVPVMYWLLKLRVT